jgi:hypothetical protein
MDKIGFVDAELAGETGFNNPLATTGALLRGRKGITGEATIICHALSWPAAIRLGLWLERMHAVRRAGFLSDPGNAPLGQRGRPARGW